MVHHVLSGVNCVIQENKATFSILEKDLSNTSNTLCSDLHRQGIGKTKNSAKVI